MKTNGETRLPYLLIGLALGAVTGLLSAVFARKEMREKLLDQGSRSLDYLNQQGKRLREGVGGVIEKGKEVMSHRCCSVESTSEAEKQAQAEEQRRETLAG